MFKAAKGVLVLAACMFALQARADDFPSRPITLLVPFDAGGSVDTIARKLADKVHQELGQSIIIEDKGGAGGIIAFEQAVHAKPDGYTIILGASSYTTIAALHNLPFDPIKDITPITLVNTGPLMLTVSSKVPATNLKDFVALLKSKPGAFTFGSPGVGSGAEFAELLFEKYSGTSTVHAQYKSDELVLEALLSGEAQIAMASGPALKPQLEAGTVRALAVTSEQPWPSMKDLPTIGSVAPGAKHVAWNGVWGPPGMPKDIVDKLNKAFVDAVNDPDMQKFQRTDIREPTTSTPQAFQQEITQEITEFRALVKSADIKVQ